MEKSRLAQLSFCPCYELDLLLAQKKAWAAAKRQPLKLECAWQQVLEAGVEMCRKQGMAPCLCSKPLCSVCPVSQCIPHEWSARELYPSESSVIQQGVVWKTESRQGR